MLRYNTKRDKHPIADRSEDNPFHACAVPTVDEVDEVINRRTQERIIKQLTSDNKRSS
jgi:uncharacterized protein (UPF0210 family)